ncbi:Pre-B-cell leukemia transcription factor 2 [Balamuthia mandrillaris]
MGTGLEIKDQTQRKTTECPTKKEISLIGQTFGQEKGRKKRPASGGRERSMTLPNRPGYAAKDHGRRDKGEGNADLNGQMAKLAAHPLMPAMASLLAKLEQSMPASHQQPTRAHFDFDEFLHSRGIQRSEPPRNQKDAKLYKALSVVQQRYEDELRLIEEKCELQCKQTLALLNKQQLFRPLSTAEIECKVNHLRQKFEALKLRLQESTRNAVIVLEEQCHGKKRRSLSKQATETLNNWFFSHLNDPYPSDEEKTALAAQCGLTLNQVNNWFGNKRIRYKRKCLEQEASRRAG